MLGNFKSHIGVPLMQITIIGGGPAGLFYAYLMKRADSSHAIEVFERDLEDAIYG